MTDENDKTDPDKVDLTRAYVEQHGATCARTVFSGGQIICIAVLMLIALVLVFLFPLACFYVALLGGSLLALLLILVRVLVYCCGIKACRNRARTLLSDDDLPVYSILVPLYQEQAIIPHLINALSELDYPAEKLDIQILVEEVDALTRSALAQQHLPSSMRVRVVPDGQPRTKPRACNYGLAQARGEFVVIYDAEDRPERDQLRKAVSEFAVLGRSCACLQARLTHYNSDRSLPAAWTDLDYLLWYSVSMNGLQRLGLPMPLGGTSNHFRTKVLRRLGGWDPFNVTEDCDLGMRLLRAGQKIRMLDSSTWEEAVTGVGAWMKQRSRWIKGFMQTALVHTRRGALREFGLYRFVGMLLFVPGSVLMQLAAPLMFIAPLMLIMQAPDELNRFQGSMLGYIQTHSAGEILHHNELMSGLLFIIGIIGVAIGVVVVLVHMFLALLRGRRDLVLTACSIPLAWCCLAVAAWRALAELIIKPFYWAKTRHGELSMQRAVLWQHPLVQRMAVIAGITGIVAITAVYLIRVDLIMYTWGQQRHELAQDTSALQRLGIIDRQHIPLRPVNDGKMATWWLQVEKNHDWSRVDGLSALVFLPQEAVASRQLQWEVRLKDRYYFMRLDPELIMPGRWTRIELDLRPWNTLIKEAGHQRAWDNYARNEIEVVRLADYESEQGDVVPMQCKDAFALKLAKADEDSDVVAMTVQARPEPLVPVFDLCEWQFEFNKAWLNPYDPAEVAIDAVCRHLESGQVLRHPAFFKIPFQRSQIDQHEVLTPAGAASWCLRWAAPQAGTWHVNLELREGGALTREFELGSVQISEARGPGYVQRHKEKPYLEHVNGDFFYPIGHNLCWPVDTKQPFKYDFELPVDSGTYAYDKYFERMADAGENWARIWMAYTWLGLEGLDSWRHFDGLGRYNQAHAERLDHVLREARRRGIYVRLTLQHYSDFSTQWGNTNWHTNPYSDRHEGPLQFAGQFLTDMRARKFHKKKLRYLVARWGWDPHLESWELWGEVNLLQGFNQQIARKWHREMIDYLHEIDNTRRPIFSHCHNWQLGMDLWPLEGLDCVQGNGYIRPPNHTPDHVVNFTNYLREVGHFNKPVFMAEYGGRSELGAPSKDYLEAQLHSGLWAGAVQPFAGAPFSWWWNFIDSENLYFHYTALQAFLEGVDRRSRALNVVTHAQIQTSGGLRTDGMQDEQGGIYWIHHPRIFVTCDISQVDNVRVRIPRLDNGSYRLRIMNTWSGAWIRDDVVNITDGQLLVALPPVQRDMALRLDRIDGND